VLCVEYHEAIKDKLALAILDAALLYEEFVELLKAAVLMMAQDRVHDFGMKIVHLACCFGSIVEFFVISKQLSNIFKIR